MHSSPEGRGNIWRRLQELVIHSMQLTAIIQDCSHVEVSTKSPWSSTPRGLSHKRQKNQGSPSFSFIFSGLQRQLSKSAGLASSKQLRNAGHFLSQHYPYAKEMGKENCLSRTLPSSAMPMGAPEWCTHHFPSRHHPIQGPTLSSLPENRWEGRSHPLASLPCLTPQGPSLSSPKLGSNILSRYSF